MGSSSRLPIDWASAATADAAQRYAAVAESSLAAFQSNLATSFHPNLEVMQTSLVSTFRPNLEAMQSNLASTLGPNLAKMQSNLMSTFQPNVDIAVQPNLTAAFGQNSLAVRPSSPLNILFGAGVSIERGCPSTADVVGALWDRWESQRVAHRVAVCRMLLVRFGRSTRPSMWLGKSDLRGGRIWIVGMFQRAGWNVIHPFDDVYLFQESQACSSPRPEHPEPRYGRCRSRAPCMERGSARRLRALHLCSRRADKRGRAIDGQSPPSLSFGRSRMVALSSCGWGCNRGRRCASSRNPIRAR